MRPILVGELNPYDTDPRYALYPYPENSAGGRLCWNILRLKPREYLSLFDRRNLCSGKWSTPGAREVAKVIERELSTGGLVVLLGSKVCQAFDLKFRPYETYSFNAPEKDMVKAIVSGGSGTLRYVVLPHPSGRCTLWNEPGAAEKAREVLRRAGIPLPPERPD